MEDLKLIFSEIMNYHKGITPDMALDCATRIFISQNIARDRKQIETEPRNELATEKQKKYLIGLGYNGDLTKLTKHEAIVLIKEGKGG